MKHKIILVTLMILVAMMPTSVFATNYTPSITYKPTPDITEIENKQDIIIYDNDEKKVSDIPWGDIVVTSIAQINDALYDDIKEKFGQSHEKLSNSSLFSLCPKLETTVKKEYPKLTEHQLVVKDLFHLAVYGTYKDHFEKPNNHIYLTFKVDISKTEPFYVLFCEDGGNWEMIQPQYVIRNSDGTVTVRFDKTGAVAFLTGQTLLENVDRDNPEFSSPLTGDSQSESHLPFVALSLLLSGLFVLMMKRSTGKNNE